MTTDKLLVKSIIFAEDDEHDRVFFRDAFEKFDLLILFEFVSNGRQLMELLNNYLPDLLFLDLEMPYKNGLQCLKEIRQNPVLKALPVVVFSSTSRPGNIQAAYEMGAHLFLVKPPSYAEYKESLYAILELDWRNPENIREQFCMNGKYGAFN